MPIDEPPLPPPSYSTKTVPQKTQWSQKRQLRHRKKYPWVTEEAIARAASEIRAVIIRSWVFYSTKTVAQLKEVLKGRKASTSGRRDQLLCTLVTLTAPEEPTPPTSHNIETSRELLVEQSQPAAFTAGEKQNLINVSSEADKTDESTSAKYKLPGVLTCFRDYISSKRQTGMRFKAYLLGKVDLMRKCRLKLYLFQNNLASMMCKRMETQDIYGQRIEL